MAQLRKVIGEYKSKFASTALALVNSIETAATGKSVPTAVLRRIEQRIIPFVRQELARTYKASGLGRDTDELFNAVVQESVVRVFPDNIVAYLPSGKSSRFYKKAASLRYGSIRNTGGATIKRKIKLAMIAGGRGQVTRSYQYFDFSPQSKARLKTIYDRLYAEEVKR
jgi:hypothetical protein